jgi:hypothetical protein
MTSSLLDIALSLILPLNFIAHLTIFIAGFYVALYNRVIPTWTSTCIWYSGLSSLFICILLLCEWMLGVHHPMSYTNLGIFAEIISDIIFSITMILLFVNTFTGNFKFKHLHNMD